MRGGGQKNPNGPQNVKKTIPLKSNNINQHIEGNAESVDCQRITNRSALWRPIWFLFLELMASLTTTGWFVVVTFPLLQTIR
ncbi:hypothetical protein OUZ56_000497 [Daphnia magna]|uniref:Uncharacterized protein n=1 Tax=Daphnia magna TaxID=35525 RepID=A0ABQ9ZZZ2_9CRUS|nr:hypothetical protein OUZ56_000497 [Daphnia magna]